MQTKTTTKASVHPWRELSGGIAWPTILYSFGVFAGTGVLWASVIAGKVGYAAGCVWAIVLAYLAFTIAHEACHGNISGGRSNLAWIDQVLGWLSGVYFLTAYPAFRVVHLRHHSYTNHPEKDPDHWVADENAGRLALRFLTILPWYYKTFFGVMQRESRAARAALVPSIWCLVGAIALVAVLGSYGLWAEVLFLWIVPAWLASGVLALVFDWLPHHPHSEQGRYVDTRAILAPGPLRAGLNVVMCGHDVHVVHHLYPRVPFYRYAELFRRIRPELEANGTPIQNLGWRGTEAA